MCSGLEASQLMTVLTRPRLSLEVSVARDELLAGCGEKARDGEDQGQKNERRTPCPLDAPPRERRHHALQRSGYQDRDGQRDEERAKARDDRS